MAMLTAIVYGADARRELGRTPQPRPAGAAPPAGGRCWAAIAALLLGGSVLMGTIAFGGQKFFEWQIEQAAPAAETSRTAPRPAQ